MINSEATRARWRKAAQVYRAKNRELCNERVREALKANPERVAKEKAKRRARKGDAFIQSELLDLVHAEAVDLRKRRNATTGVEWHIDHIVPLRGKAVSGLHTWNNLQVIPATLNRQKNNKWESTDAY